jgi:hypothetical protein
VNYLTQQENGICFPAEKYLQNQLKVELKKGNTAKKRNIKKKTAKPL